MINQRSTAPTFAEWQAEYFTTEELADDSISGADSDPDGDGLTNLGRKAREIITLRRTPLLLQRPGDNAVDIPA